MPVVLGNQCVLISGDRIDFLAMQWLFLVIWRGAEGWGGGGGGGEGVLPFPSLVLLFLLSIG